MSWYIWVWGVLSTLAALAWIAVGVQAFAEEYKEARQKKRARELYGNSLIDAELKIDRLTQELREARKGANEFGRISP